MKPLIVYWWVHGYTKKCSNNGGCIKWFVYNNATNCVKSVFWCNQVKGILNEVSLYQFFVFGKLWMVENVYFGNITIFVTRREDKIDKVYISIYVV